MSASRSTGSNSTSRVLIVGAGYAGATAAVRLAGRGRGRVEVTVVNPRPGFVNRIRLHHVAVGKRVAAPDLRGLLGSGVTLVEGAVTELDADAGRATVAGPDGTRVVAFDRAVIATGSTTGAAPIPGAELVHGVADIESARRLRAAFAAVAPGADVTVVGGGFTGLETVAELAEARADVRVRLVTADDAGGWFTPRAREHVRATLGRLGVEIVDGVRACAVECDRVLLDDGSEAPSALTVWCGGFAVPPLARDAGIAVDAGGAVLTDAALRSVSHPAVLAVGDAGHTPGPRGERHSMSCQYAYPSGAHAADVLLGEVAGGAADGRDGAAFDLAFTARCVGLGDRAAVLQPTTDDDVARGRALTGRPAAVVKWAQLRGIVAPIGMERRMPGLIRWSHAGRTAAAAPSAAG